MTKHPSAKGVSFVERLGNLYGAPQSRQCLAQFVAEHTHPDASTAQINYFAAIQPQRFDKVPVYHKAKFWGK